MLTANNGMLTTRCQAMQGKLGRQGKGGTSTGSLRNSRLAQGTMY